MSIPKSQEVPLKAVRVFISYSWTSQEYKNHIRQLAERLMDNGVDVVLDQWDLKEGDDKYKFMESMVNDKSITHVLVFSDAEYASKADSRKAGVGTETQIISQEIYSRTEEKESKFIPIVCELDSTDKACLPTFLEPLFFINFSSPELVKQNWERLIRVIYGKPAHKKPTLGPPPKFITEDNAVPTRYGKPAHKKPTLGKSPKFITEDNAIPANYVITTFANFQKRLTQGDPNSKLYRKKFLDACYKYADNLRTRSHPNVESNEEMGKLVLGTCGNLTLIRDHIVDWVLLESETDPLGDFSEALLDMLDRLVELKSRPSGVNTWNDIWFEAHCVFVYETFLYIVAALMKNGAFNILHDVFNNRYILPETEAHGTKRFTKFEVFWSYSQTLQILADEGKRLNSAAAELIIKKQTKHTDIQVEDIMEAELLILMVSSISEDVRWHPQTFYYLPPGTFPFFFNATQRRGFKKIATITGITDADELRKLVKTELNRIGTGMHGMYSFSSEAWERMNMEKLDTLN